MPPKAKAAAPDPVVYGKPISAYTTDELLKLQKFGPAILGAPDEPEAARALFQRAQQVARETKQGKFGPAILANPAEPEPVPAA